MLPNIIQQVFDLKKRNFNYNQIAKQLGINRCSVRYYLNLEQEKEKARQYKNQHKLHPDHVLSKKIQNFQSKRRAYNNKEIERFSLEDFKRHLNGHYRCYLTGQDINLSDTKSYQLDHIIPIAQGGKNTLENCGLVSKKANQAKNELSHSDFITLCLRIVKHHGYYPVPADVYKVHVELKLTKSGTT
jgi:CRISPR/Cas system Type II protein with McrA/HNH and RuvC-like nuclease domain